ncbi:MAG: hypothetical protein ACI936_003494 [Paraglaciecola sp.]|jgi:hypothetical protein
MTVSAPNSSDVVGQFIDMEGERYYAIRNMQNMAPFFISLISDSDHWLFVSSTGGLTAGRVSPETALFPYAPVDKIHESAANTGCKTLLQISKKGQTYKWDAFNKDFNHQYRISQNLYKNILGDKICFEEVNHDLQLAFRYTWATSDEFGFCRQCELQNLADEDVSVKMIDGLNNILPAGTPRFTQTVSSNLVDAYKWSELHKPTGLAMFTLYSGITDRAEPSESLKANTLFSLGFDEYKVLLCTAQLDNFWRNEVLETESAKRGIRGAYFLNAEFELPPKKSRKWQLVANLEQNQSQISMLIQSLGDQNKVIGDLSDSISEGSDILARIMAASDGFQVTSEENVSVHHYANTLFNNLRGGVFDNQYSLSTRDFIATLKTFNVNVHSRHVESLSKLPEEIALQDFSSIITSINDPQLERLAAEYLPITFGRRHGDPSRPWNQFEIKLKDDTGHRLLSYQGNWRDIFQNWEALTFSYPEFIECVIAKFVNASTIDGYNPYRITKGGIDWEVEEPDDPWSYIGYWGDHQIIYLLKMLELSKQFHPKLLVKLLNKPIFSYANVPYRIKSFDDMLNNAKSTVTYDENSAERIAEKVTQFGADGKLILDKNGDVYQVNLLEKLLVPLLCKLGNLVVDGGIWLNAQRPEWNDANNALVGQGLSMVTLNYLRRYVRFFQGLMKDQPQTTELSYEVALWLKETSEILQNLSVKLDGVPVSDMLRFEVLQDLGQAAWRYRQAIYTSQSFSHKENCSVETVNLLLSNALVAIDHTIHNNVGNDGLHQSYNLLDFDGRQASVENLYPMLEGQVAAISSGAINPKQTADVLDALFASDVYRADQKTFMLYPDRVQTPFLDKNVITLAAFNEVPVLAQMMAAYDVRIVMQDADGGYRFNPNIKNNGELINHLKSLSADYPALDKTMVSKIESLYEKVFNHQSFTGRSGGMFGFEGLGSVYWHMVSKLLLALKENFYTAVEEDAEPELIKRLGSLYYRVRGGIGFNKSPDEYGAFPCDPYSHTPKHAGAQQPGMTGQVKEEILSRFGELGIHVLNGEVEFKPKLLRSSEFVSVEKPFRYLDVQNEWQQTMVPKNGIGFTWCQVPVLYELSTGKPTLTITLSDGKQITSSDLTLAGEYSHALFNRTGFIKQIIITLNTSQLLND